MPAVEKNKIEVAHPDLEIIRTFAAPRSVVFRAWVDPVQLAAWWGPRGFTNPLCELDVRPGGSLLIHMKGPDGVIYPMTGEFKEIEDSRKLVFSGVALNEKGEKVIEDLTTVLFDEIDGVTRILLTARITMSKAEAAPMLEGMNEGWTQSLDKLTEYLVKAAVH